MTSIPGGGFTGLLRCAALRCAVAALRYAMLRCAVLSGRVERDPNVINLAVTTHSSVLVALAKCIAYDFAPSFPADKVLSSYELAGGLKTLFTGLSVQHGKPGGGMCVCVCERERERGERRERRAPPPHLLCSEALSGL
eukprot:SAG22_NODE_119_length_19257_cov_43.260413_25_plen_139_part_00